MGIITLRKLKVFSKGKESFESILTVAQLWGITYVIPLLWLTRYQILF